MAKTIVDLCYGIIVPDLRIEILRSQPPLRVKPFPTIDYRRIAVVVGAKYQFVEVERMQSLLRTCVTPPRLLFEEDS